MGLVDGGTHHARSREGLSVFRAALREPRHQVGDGHYAGGQIDDLLGLANFHGHHCSAPFTPLALDGRAHGGLEVVEAGPQRQQRRHP
jgi:hypothetical protein